MNTKKRMTVCLLAAALTISGCGEGNLDLSEENRALVTEYAAGILLKYSQGYDQTLTEIPRVKEEPKPAVQDTAAESAQAGAETSGGDSAVQNVTVEETLGLNPAAVRITFEGYQVCGSYPEPGAAEDAYFSMDATSGRELYVFHFLISNVSDTEQNCDILHSNAKFRFRFDKKGQENALTTLLMDDLQTLSEAVEPGGQRRAVLVLERDQGLSGSVGSIDMLVKNEDKTAAMELTAQGNGGTVPAAGEAAPEESEMVPAAGGAAPEDSEMVPENGGAASLNGDSVPENGEGSEA